MTGLVRSFAAATTTAVTVMLMLPALAHAEDRLIVGFKPATPTETRSTQLRGAGAGVRAAGDKAIAKGVARLNATTVVVPEGQANAVARKLRASASVAYVEVDNVARVTGSTNDPMRSKQWALGKLRATTAWDSTVGTGALVAVVDTGVSFDHPDLNGRIDSAAGWDFVDNDADASDVQGHGTHVAGIVAANGNNGVGVAGVSYGARILPVRVLDADGSGYYSWIANGIVFAADRGAKVINLSLGGSQSSTTLENAVNYAVQKGAVVTCATGNDGSSSIGYPARYSSCFAVGSTTSSDARSSFSQYGTNIDVVAPGSSVLSTVIGGGYEQWSGTSMATPHVSGVAALLASKGLSRSQIESAITGTAIDLGNAGYDTVYGAGRVDAASAVQAAASGEPAPAPSDDVAPTVSGVSVGPVEMLPGTVRSYRWRVVRRTKWRVVGRSKRVGSYNWTSVAKGTTWRRYTKYRMRRGVVRKRVVMRKRRTVYRQGYISLRPVTVTAVDNVAVARVRVTVGGRWIASDKNASDGWKIKWRCVPGTHTFAAQAFDASGNQASAQQSYTVTC